MGSGIRPVQWMALAPAAINEIDSWRLFVVRSGIVLLVNTWLMIGS